ncbi:MAG TPA: sigma-70 family RNA polymerase sigma factor [Candidatus Limadaptatus stercorigallinarum]|uniref:Sigma-70 family RNA polymerase sigma factor n=1 Tax=Candidatus Limadaptatus stercorigallinarum TaxID=2840845 RepID=A0A9D1HSF5_9FIRM|nr:sigma-70 family RNA polymerase sigma factor [Candidatus Limadaptatus stercorigallinarum]
MKNEAIERLFKKYYNEAKLYVAALCHDEALAEDIVSESFYKAFTRIDEEKESFKFWLLKVCRNAYFDYLKKNRRLSALHDNMAADTADLAEKVIEDEEYRALYRAIALLKDNYREVILLYYFDELSVSEIAGITEQSVQNVKVLMYRARMKLKEILED